MLTSPTSSASLHLRLWYRNYIAKAIDALQVTQRTLDILRDDTAEAQEETYNREFYSLPKYWMPEKEPRPPVPPETAIPIPLGKDNIHLLHQPSNIHVHKPERLEYVIWTHRRTREHSVFLEWSLYSTHRSRKLSVWRWRPLYIVFILCSDEGKKEKTSSFKRAGCSNELT